MSKFLIWFVSLLLVPCLVIDSGWAFVSFPKVSPIQSQTDCFDSQTLSNLALAFSKLRMGKRAGSDDVTFIEAGFPRQEAGERNTSNVGRTIEPDRMMVRNEGPLEGLGQTSTQFFASVKRVFVPSVVPVQREEQDHYKRHGSRVIPLTHSPLSWAELEIWNSLRRAVSAVYAEVHSPQDQDPPLEFRIFESNENSTVTLIAIGDRTLIYVNRKFLKNLISIEKTLTIRSMSPVDDILTGMALFTRAAHQEDQGKLRLKRFTPKEASELQVRRGGSPANLRVIGAYGFYLDYAGIPTYLFSGSLQGDLFTEGPFSQREIGEIEDFAYSIWSDSIRQTHELSKKYRFHDWIRMLDIVSILKAIRYRILAVLGLTWDSFSRRAVRSLLERPSWSKHVGSFDSAESLKEAIAASFQREPKTPSWQLPFQHVAYSRGNPSEGQRERTALVPIQRGGNQKFSSIWHNLPALPANAKYDLYIEMVEPHAEAGGFSISGEDKIIHIYLRGGSGQRNVLARLWQFLRTWNVRKLNRHYQIRLRTLFTAA